MGKSRRTLVPLSFSGRAGGDPGTFQTFFHLDMAPILGNNVRIMRSVLMLALCAVSAASQPFSLGAKGGVPVTALAYAQYGSYFPYHTLTNRYLIGPTVELMLGPGAYWRQQMDKFAALNSACCSRLASIRANGLKSSALVVDPPVVTEG